MTTLARRAALLTLTAALLAGCDAAPNKKPQADASAVKTSQDVKKEVAKAADKAPPADAKADAKAPAKDAKADAKSAEAAEEEAGIKKELAKLSPEDRKLAEAQRYCAINNDERLGGMGVPMKVMLKDKAVFLCCGSCKKQALADPDKTLAKAEEMKKKAAAETK